MFTFVLSELLAATAMVQAPATVPAEAPKTRRVCRDLPGAFTRTPRRVCTMVREKEPAVTSAAPAAPVRVATTFEAGMAVVDTQGAEVGTITAVAADTVTVKTAKNQAQLPKTSLTISDGKALFGLSQAELDAQVEQTLATSQAGPAVGGAVNGRDGANVGTIDAVEADGVTIKLATGQKISIPRSGIATGADGISVIGLTAVELEAQVKASQPQR